MRLAAAGLLLGMTLTMGAVSARQSTETTLYIRGGADDPSLLVSRLVVSLGMSANLRAASLTLAFDPSIIEPERIELDSGWTASEESVASEPGSLHIDAVRMGPPCTGGSQCGLATVTWKPVSAGESRLELSDVELIDESGAIEPVTLVGGRIDVAASRSDSSGPRNEAPANRSSGDGYELAAIAFALVVLACTALGGSTLLVVTGRKMLGSGRRPDPTRPGAADFGRSVATYLQDVEAAGSVDEKREQ